MGKPQSDWEDRIWGHVNRLFPDMYSQQRKNVIDIVDMALQSHWVSISNGLPNDLDDVLVAESDSDYTTIGFYNKELNIWQDRTYDILSVTHWMPFPSPPKNHRNEKLKA